MGLLNRAVRNVWRKKTRTLLVVIALGFSITAIISVYTGVNASINNTKKMISGYQQYINETGELSESQERMIQVSSGFGGRMPGGGSFPGATTISQDVIENISTMDNVEAVVPLIERAVGEPNFEEMRDQWRQNGEPGVPPEEQPQPGQNTQDRMESLFDYVIMGIPIDSSLDESYSLLPTNITSGRKITEDDEFTVMIRDTLTESDANFSGAVVGDLIDIEGYNFTVVGIYSSDTNRNYIYMDISDARKVLGLEEGQAYTLSVYAQDISYVDMVVYEIQENFTTLRVTSYADMYSQFSERMSQQQESQIASLTEDSKKIENTGNQIIIISVITAALIVLFLMIYTVKERTKEIGLLKAIGFSGKNITIQFILEGTLIGFLSGLVGIILGVLIGPFLSGVLLPATEGYAVSTPSVMLIIEALFLTIFLGFIGTIYPAWQASKKSPMEAMRNE